MDSWGPCFTAQPDGVKPPAPGHTHRQPLSECLGPELLPAVGVGTENWHDIVLSDATPQVLSANELGSSSGLW